MNTNVFPDPETAARQAAAFIASEAKAAISSRGAFILAVSGGRTPWIMLRDLASLELPWDRVHIIQVDERVAPAGHQDRNLTHLNESLLGRSPLRPDHIHPMPVESPDLEAAAAQYARTLAALANSPPIIDLVHLGLGPDGHAASLIPGDPVLNVTDKDVAPTGVYQNRRRLTLTYPIINRARRILWVVTGGEKAAMLARLAQRDQSIPAGRVRQDCAVLYADEPAAAGLRPAQISGR